MSLNSAIARLEYMGGNSLERINKQKLRSFQAALTNDYNSRAIRTPQGKIWQCLINANNLKPDYDKKIVSVEFESHLQAGDVFTVLDDNTKWMVYLPILTETAYLRAEIIRCRYELEIDGENYPIYFQGPTETAIKWYSKNSIEFNKLNYSGTIYIKNNEKTKQYFNRFTILKIDGHNWQVKVTDSISVPGVLEIEVGEYFDDDIAEIPEVIATDAAAAIIGQTNVFTNSVVGYQIAKEYYNPDIEWSIAGSNVASIKEVYNDGLFCKVEIGKQTGSYTIKYGSYSLSCTIEAPQTTIEGPQEVYPYDTIIYSIGENTGTFSLDCASNIATILESTENSCKVYIATGKKASFILTCELENEVVFELPVKVKSL